MTGWIAYLNDGDVTFRRVTEDGLFLLPGSVYATKEAAIAAVQRVALRRVEYAEAELSEARHQLHIVQRKQMSLNN